MDQATVDLLYAAVHAEPYDHVRRLVLADALDELQESDPVQPALGPGYRAMGLLTRAPTELARGYWWSYAGNDDPRDVWAADNMTEEEQLPSAWFRQLKRLVYAHGLTIEDDGEHERYVTTRRVVGDVFDQLAVRRRIEDAAAKAFVNLPEPNRVSLLKGLKRWVVPQVKQSKPIPRA